MRLARQKQLSDLESENEIGSSTGERIPVPKMYVDQCYFRTTCYQIAENNNALFHLKRTNMYPCS